MTKNAAIVTLLLVVLVSCAFYVGRGTIYATMQNLKLIPQPERFTELYFDNYLSLPKNTVAGKPIAFIFTIHNLEGVTTTYPYAVYLDEATGTRIIFESGLITLADGESRNITVSFPALTSNLTGKVTVNLTTLNQPIDFLLTGTSQ